MDGHDGLLGALLGAVVIGSVIGVTSSAARRRYQASGAQPRGAPFGPARGPQINRVARPAPPVAPAPRTDLAAQLQQLAQLRDAGVLTEEEFVQAKQKVLRG